MNGKQCLSEIRKQQAQKYSCYYLFHFPQRKRYGRNHPVSAALFYKNLIDFDDLSRALAISFPVNGSNPRYFENPPADPHF